MILKPFSSLKYHGLGILLIFVFFNINGVAQEVNWDLVWQQEVKSSKINNANKLNDILKWISQNVDYETNSEYHKELSNVDRPVAENAYKNGKAVCIGYAKLLQTLCTAADIPALTVEGIVHDRYDNSMENHAWNLVYYEDEWRVVDPTWASGTIENDVYKSRFKKQYVNISIEEREFSHYPYDPVLQARLNPITYSEFKNRKKKDSLESQYDRAFLDSILFKYPGLNDTSALKRSLMFKPRDPFLQQVLADAYMQSAEKKIQPCIKIYSNGPTESEVKNCQSEILETKKLLLKSQKLYREVNTDQQVARSSTQINLQNIERNLNTLERMKSFTP
jgi:hypothetical protein